MARGIDGRSRWRRLALVPTLAGVLLLAGACEPEEVDEVVAPEVTDPPEVEVEEPTDPTGPTGAALDATEVAEALFPEAVVTPLDVDPQQIVDEGGLQTAAAVDEDAQPGLAITVEVYGATDLRDEARAEWEGEDVHFAECGEILVVVEGGDEVDDTAGAAAVAESAQAHLDVAYDCEPSAP